MARLRTIDQTSVLDAAETVIIENGAANLTLDAVAACAGISKGSVLRDYASKHDLIRAIVQRRFGEYQAMLDTAEQQTPTRIAAHIEVAAQPWSNDQRTAASNLCSSMANDDELMSIIASHYEREFAAVAADSDGRGPMMAFLALEGLRSIEMFGRYNFKTEDREAILRAISKISETHIPNVD